MSCSFRRNTGRGYVLRRNLAYPHGVRAKSFGGEAEALAVAGRAHADAPVEGTAQDLGAGEPGGPGHSLERLGAVLQEGACAPDSQRLDIRDRGLADLRAKRAGE